MPPKVDEASSLVGSLRKKIEKWVASIISSMWYGNSIGSIILLPFSYIFACAVFARRGAYRWGFLRAYRAPVPVIIVGNITTGGTGKTPLIIWLAKFLKENGFRPGIICRGYRGRSSEWPIVISERTEVQAAGDEAILLFKKSGCPVVAGPNRICSTKALMKIFKVNVILSDDGLQHYSLERTVEVAVIDGLRRFGNGRLFPAGPLRENKRRLKEADFVVVKGSPQDDEFGMSVQVGDLINMKNPGYSKRLDSLKESVVNAVSGIGHNESFFRILANKQIVYRPRPFPDHFEYSEEDLDFGDDLEIVMTEKDAVKCEKFARDGHWSLSINVSLSEDFGTQILKKIRRGFDE